MSDHMKLKCVFQIRIYLKYSGLSYKRDRFLFIFPGVISQDFKLVEKAFKNEDVTITWIPSQANGDHNAP